MHNARLNGRSEIKSDWTLFDAGELGSELALVKSIFETLGTPGEKSWPECMTLPDWGKMAFVVFPTTSWADILVGCEAMAIDLVAKLVQYQSTERMSAAQVRTFITLSNACESQGNGAKMAKVDGLR